MCRVSETNFLTLEKLNRIRIKKLTTMWKKKIVYKAIPEYNLFVNIYLFSDVHINISILLEADDMGLGKEFSFTSPVLWYF